MTTYLRLVFTLFIALVSATTFAQGQDANSDELTLEQKYQEDLDTWMLRAYEGDRDAQFKVGVLFANDQFSQPDFEQSVYWYKQAARQGHVLAQYNLGHQYLNGLGVEQNIEAAMQWWLSAARSGHELAQFNIGRAYYLGIGLAEDTTKARYWFETAASNNEPKSIEILKQLGWDTPSPSIASVVQVPADEQNALNDEPASAADDSTVGSAPKDANPLSQQQQTQVATTSSDEAGKPLEQHQETEKISASIALYTNPAIRSVLIAITDQQNKLQVIKQTPEWTQVRSQDGFPVWVHGDYLTINDNVGTITATSVNSRSVPIVTNGSIVGRFNKGEKVNVLNQLKEWYRVTSPAHFNAWVKTKDFNQLRYTLEASNNSATTAAPKIKQAVSEASNSAEIISVAKTPTAQGETHSDNQWLFSQTPESFTLQLASFDDSNNAIAFMSQSKFENDSNLRRFTSTSKGISWTFFLYGSYNSTESAQQAKKILNAKRAWIRNVGKLQQSRCVAWKKQLPSPKELNDYCVSKTHNERQT